MINSMQKYALIGLCLVSGVMRGMQTQPQSTSSVTSIPVAAQFSQTGESKEISFPRIQRQHALIGSLLANPAPLQSFMSSNAVAVPVNNAGTVQSINANQAVAAPILNARGSSGIDWNVLYTYFTYGIQQKNDQIVEMFLEQYAIGFELIKKLIHDAEYECLDQLFGVIKMYDLFSIDEVPVANELTLLEFACECYYNDQTEKRKSIIKLLLAEGASIVRFVKANSIAWVDFLLPCGVGEDFDEHGFSELHKFCSSKEMIALLMHYNIEQYESGSAYEALIDAVDRYEDLVDAVDKNETLLKDDKEKKIKTAKNKGIAAIKKAIHQGINVPTIFDTNGNHLLAVAAQHNDSELAELLLIFAHMKLDYLVTTGDYQSLKFILCSTLNYALDQHDGKKLLAKAQKRGNKEIIALLSESMELEESREKNQNDDEIKAMTNKAVGQISFTKSETEFIFAMSQYQYKKAQEILAQDSTIRLTSIEIAEKNLMAFILSDPLTSQCVENQKEFVAFLLKNHFNKLYPMIQDMVRNNQYEYLKKLIACGLDVNAKARFEGTEELLYGKPETTCSLLGVAFQETARRNNNDITMIIFLLKAQASLPEFLKERGFDCTQHDFQILEKVIAAIGTKIPHDWFEKRKLCTETDLWTLGVLLFESITNSDQRSLSVLMKELPSILVTQPKQNSVEHVAHIVAEHNSVSSKKSKKRHLNDEEIIESQNTDKHVKVEHKQEERREQTTAPRLSLTPSLSETATVHQVQPVPLIRPFDPSRWLNTVSLDVTRS